MANSLFVSYDLHTPGQNYKDVVAEIKRHGSWAKVHYSLFYLSSAESAKQVASEVWAKMDANDRLMVIDASNNEAFWHNLPSEVTEHLQSKWSD